MTLWWLVEFRTKVEQFFSTNGFLKIDKHTSIYRKKQKQITIWDNKKNTVHIDWLQNHKMRLAGVYGCDAQSSYGMEIISIEY